MIARAVLYLTIILVHLRAVEALAQSDTAAAEIKITTAISSSSVSQGDILTYSITFSWPGEQGRVLIEEFKAPALKNLYLLETKTELSFYEESQRKYSRKECLFYFSADSIGTAKILPFTLNYYDTRTDESGSYTTPAYDLTIRAPSLAGRRFAWFLLTAAVLLGLGYIFRLYRRFKKPPSELLAEKTIEEQILEKLEALPAGDIKSALSQLRKIVINYLELKFGHGLMGKTNSEVLENLNQLENESRQLLEEVLDTTEQARFNPGLGESSVLQETITKLRRFVELQQGQPVK